MRINKALGAGLVALLLVSMVMVVSSTPWDGVPDDPTSAQAIWVDPKNTTCFDLGETFVIDVLINITSPTMPGNGTGLWGFEYKLKWESTVLEAESIRYHSPWFSDFVVKNETGSGLPEAPEGFDYHWLSISAMSPSSAFTGVTSLCTYTFRVISDGSCTLNIYDDILGDDTATQFAHTTVDGRVTVTNICVIRADGSVLPPTAPISTVDNITYTLTGNIEKPIVVERDNIVVAGAGYTLQGTGGGKGISMLGRSNVTIKNMRIESFGYGIWLRHSSNNTISGNNITDSGYGIWLENSSSNNISENKITGCGLFGMGLYSSSSNNRLYGNNMTNNSVGIWLWDSSNNTFSGNVMNDNPLANFGGVGGYELEHFMHSIDVSNLADGKPVYYLVNQTDLVISSATHQQVGYLALINCVNVTAEGLTLTGNGEGLLLAYTNNSRITDNNIVDSQYGVVLFMSFNNTFSKNTITDNYAEGFHLELSSDNTVSGNTVTNSLWGIRLYGSSNNSIYHNNFVDNLAQVYAEDSVSVWDDGYPSGGSYWSDHNPQDSYSGPYQNETGRDKIGDTPYIIHGNNTDRYPLIYPFGYVPSPDVNADGIVNILDIVLCAVSFGSKPGDPDWNPYVDSNQDGIINILDILGIAVHFGETW